MTSLEDYAPDKPGPGWENYAEQWGQTGKAAIRLPRPDVPERDLLASSGFNPDVWSIKPGSIQVRRWMNTAQDWLYYYKFDCTSAEETPEQRHADVEYLREQIHGMHTPNRRKINAGDDAWLFCASDWQIGKGEGDGTAGTVARVTAAIEQAVEQVKALRKAGRSMPQGCLSGTGDLGEGTCGFFSNQPFVTDLNRREQNKVTRSLLTYAIDELAPLFDEFLVLTVPGNHGENRQNGKKATDDGDNDDVAQFECVKEAFDRGGENNITWVIPTEEMSLAADLGGVKVGFTHGHLFTTGGKLAQAKALEWWKGQAFGLQAVSSAQILVSSHFHHFSVIDHGARTHFQTPAMDPGSRWVTNAWGSDAQAGLLTMRLDGTHPRGWDDLKLLDGIR